MATYNINLTTNYCSHWGLWEAIREILQNGEDQFTLNVANQISVNYNKKTKTLIVSNKESILERHTLLLGGTEKQENDKTIGKFGEGYKIALLIFEKLGLKTTIKNYAKNEKWTSSLKPDSKYNNLPVLKVHIHKYLIKKVPDNNLSFEIQGIEESDWAEITKNYLRVQDKGVVFKESTYENEILFEDKFKGKVFVNGLFVEQLEDTFKLGYNMHPSCLNLDRDRRSIVDYSFRSHIARMLTEYAESSEEAAKFVVEGIKNKDSDYTLVKYLIPNLNDNSNLIQESKIRFKEKNENNSYPVSNQEEYDFVNNNFSKTTPVIVSSVEMEMLKRSKEYKTVESFQECNGLKESVEVIRDPTYYMELFLNENRAEMFSSAISNFEKMIKESKKWTLKEESLLIEENENSDKKIDDIENKNNEDIDYLEKTNIIAGFDDDIPF